MEDGGGGGGGGVLLTKFLHLMSHNRHIEKERKCQPLWPSGKALGW